MEFAYKPIFIYYRQTSRRCSLSLSRFFWLGKNVTKLTTRLFYLIHFPVLWPTKEGSTGKFVGRGQIFQSKTE
jgi:hypothetical protein